MEEKESEKYVKYEDTDKVRYTPDPISVHDVIGQLMVDVVEEQDRLIMQNIQHIGGKLYERITIDKNKTLDALSKATAKKLTVVKDVLFNKVRACPTCGRWLNIPALSPRPSTDYNYCTKCGQKLDWSEVEHE